VKTPVLILTSMIAAAIAAGIYAANRFTTDRNARDQRIDAQEQLQTAMRLADEYPRAFGPQASSPASESPIKTLAQEFATSRGVTIGYLSESERDANKGKRERQVLIRLVNASHPNLVHFLEDLESRGCGARIREIHVRPSRVISDAYEEAEVVVSKVVRAAEGKTP
jgi:hypothetical protein